MPLFVIFIFGAVVLGAGAMLAPAWNTAQPRIGLMAALALGLIMGGAIFWAMLFGWNTLVIDYLLFALVTAIFLGGTLSYGQKRAEAKGETLLDSDQGWPGPHDLLLFGLATLIFIIPVLILPVPLDTDAQGFGYLSLLVKLGGSFRTLAPWHPEVSYLYSPGFPLLVAYLSQQLNQSIASVQIAVGAVLSVMLVWLAYDFGSELRDKRLGRAMAVAMLFGLGLFTSFMDSHYTTLLGLVFVMAFLTYTLRFLRRPAIPDAIAAGLMLGAVVLSQPDATIILALGFVPWLLTIWLGKPRPTFRVWLVIALGIPLIALISIAPWLSNVRDLLGSNIASPFTIDPQYWLVMVLYHGVWIVPVAILGAVVGIRSRNQAAILSTIWLILLLEFSSLGILGRIAPDLFAPLLRYDYPFSLAWNGPIIPYAILGGIGLLWIWDRWFDKRWSVQFNRWSYGILGALIIIVLAIGFFNQPLLSFSKDKVGFFGAFASQADVQAMDWLKNNSPTDARILNFPGTLKDNSHESDWVPVISERDTVYYRWQPFFRGDEASLAEQDQLRVFWENPADPANAALLKAAHISYVIVPQIVTNPVSEATMFRWRPPVGLIDMRSKVSDAPYLKKVFDQDGAQVYEFVSG